jgi:hypothetical protein
MRAAVYYGKNKLAIEDVPEPTQGEGQVEIKASPKGSVKARACDPRLAGPACWDCHTFLSNHQP